jgi:CRISPR/Cas system-associated protein Csm6
MLTSEKMGLSHVRKKEARRNKKHLHTQKQQQQKERRDSFAKTLRHCVREKPKENSNCLQHLIIFANKSFVC